VLRADLPVDHCPVPDDAIGRRDVSPTHVSALVTVIDRRPGTHTADDGSHGIRRPRTTRVRLATADEGREVLEREVREQAGEQEARERDARRAALPARTTCSGKAGTTRATAGAWTAWNHRRHWGGAHPHPPIRRRLACTRRGRRAPVWTGATPRRMAQVPADTRAQR
jgi:hypothetical protein